MYLFSKYDMFLGVLIIICLELTIYNTIYAIWAVLYTGFPWKNPTLVLTKSRILPGAFLPLTWPSRATEFACFSVGEVPKIVGFFVPQNNLPQQIAGPSKAKKEISELQLKLSQFGNLFQKCVVFII